MNCFVYKIQPTCSHEPNEIYIGSTIKPLRRRLQNHKADYTMWKKGTRSRNTTIFSLFEKYGVDYFEIIELQEFQNITKKELFMHERHYQSILPCINIRKPYCSEEEIKEQRKKTKKEYREKNAESIKIKMHNYYIENKSELLEKSIQTYYENKDKILEQKKNKYQETKMKKINIDEI